MKNRSLGAWLATVEAVGVKVTTFPERGLVLPWIKSFPGLLLILLLFSEWPRSKFTPN